MTRTRGVWAGAVVLLSILLGGTAFFVWQQARGNPIPAGTPSGQLAFISDRDGKWDIFLMNVDGSVANLTAPGDDAHDYFPSWAFNGDMINFISSRSGETGPAQVRPDGSELRTLSITDAIMTIFLAGRLDWDPQWAPDGQRLGWSSLRDLNLELYIAEVDGSNQQRLTSDGARDWFMAWSPDSTRIVFNSDRGGSENIYLLDPVTGERQQLTDHTADDFRAAWSLEGDRLLFVSERDASLTTGQLNLYLMDTDGSNQRAFGPGDLFRGAAAYSADGQQVVYMSNEEGQWNLYIMDADGGNVRRITSSSSNDMYPVWRPVPPEG